MSTADTLYRPEVEHAAAVAMSRARADESGAGSIRVGASHASESSVLRSGNATVGRSKGRSPDLSDLAQRPLEDDPPFAGEDRGSLLWSLTNRSGEVTPGSRGERDPPRSEPP